MQQHSQQEPPPNLVHCRPDSAVGVQLLQVVDAVVADADRTALARSQDVLHRTPRLQAGVGTQGRVDEVQVHWRGGERGGEGWASGGKRKLSRKGRELRRCIVISEDVLPCDPYLQAGIGTQR